MIRHFSHIFLVEGLTFIVFLQYFARTQSVATGAIQSGCGRRCPDYNRDPGHRECGKDLQIITMLRFLLKSAGYYIPVKGNVDIAEGDEIVSGLDPAQIGALVAFGFAVLLIWRVMRRSE